MNTNVEVADSLLPSATDHEDEVTSTTQHYTTWQVNVRDNMIILPFFCGTTAGSTGITESLTAGIMAGGSSNSPPGSLEKFSPAMGAPQPLTYDTNITR